MIQLIINILSFSIFLPLPFFRRVGLIGICLALAIAGGFCCGYGCSRVRQFLIFGLAAIDIADREGSNGIRDNIFFDVGVTFLGLSVMQLAIGKRSGSMSMSFRHTLFIRHSFSVPHLHHPAESEPEVADEVAHREVVMVGVDAEPAHVLGARLPFREL